MSPVPEPFRIDVAPETLAWVTDRVKTARVIPDIQHPQGKEWAHGIPTSAVQELVDYWRDEYDWRKVEQRLNLTFKMFTVDIEEAGETLNVHFVHHRSSRGGAVPLIFAHGWPGNFLEVEHLLKLTEPEDPAQQAFHIVAPSIPGFVFSSEPQHPDFTIARIASVYHKLMQTLGYTHYVGQGGDWGSFILRSMAISFPEACVGIHLNYIFAIPPSPVKNPLALLRLVVRWFTADEKTRLARIQWWMKEEFGYTAIQGTKPQTVSYALLDSPVGMLAWIREKMQDLTDPDFTWPKETVVTWAMLYLLSGNAGHARLYKNGMQTAKGEVLDVKISKEVAFGASCFPRDVGYVPRWWAQASIADNIVFWREHEKGGHFASLECSDVLERDFLEFFGKISVERRAVFVKAGKETGAS
ncbi:putative epoxide hydrolase N terminus [Lyophyllum shimeji]|uniref:Epoxide hydrolase N terminus n=1 Tax=Lyophyllum shimeji TaxID=47721 RepID=A0A9P3PJY3_LYOSH|nr:putative epoxide hydrolase N terminus [Lyophyllum shimeji]